MAATVTGARQLQRRVLIYEDELFQATSFAPIRSRFA